MTNLSSAVLAASRLCLLLFATAAHSVDQLQMIPPTCLPPTEPNCGLIGYCPDKLYCSRFEGTEYCCKVSPINGSIMPSEQDQKAFLAFIERLRKSTERKDAYAVIRQVSSDFSIEGGAKELDPAPLNAAATFLSAFPLDAQGAPWIELRSIVSAQTFSVQENGELCASAGRQPEPRPQKSMLCFALNPDGRWMISRQARAGD